MTTLYRKYRPRNFEEVVGQNHIKITLSNEIQTENIAHSYLFCGPRAVGKTTLARVFSKAVNCENRKKGQADPCSKCDICEEITMGRSLDIIEIDAASHTGVDNVRENIITSARLAPSKCKFKVFIIDEVHMLSISAFNALLKILEEPPENVIFILCTTEVHKIPSTIISRCQRFDFRRIGVSDVVKKLSYIIRKEEISVDKEILEEIARRSEGYMRDAESLLGQIVAIGGKKITKKEADLVLPRSDVEEIIKLIDFLIKKDSAKGVELINNLIDNGIDIKVFLDDLVEVLRMIMLNKLNPGLSANLGLAYGEGIDAKISEISKNLIIKNVIRYIEKFSEAKIKIKDSFITQMPVEIAIIDLGLGVVPQKANPGTSIPDATKATENIAKAIPVSSPVNTETAISKWSEVLVAIKKYNHSLSLILRACQPKSIEGDTLNLVFKYKFHQDRINDIEIKPIVVKVLSEVYGRKLEVNSVVDENLEINNTTPTANHENETKDNKVEDKSNVAKEESSGVDNLLKTFGGRVVK